MKRSRKLKKLRELEKLERRKMMERIEERAKRKEMETFRLEDIDFETNLNITDVLEIVDKFIQEQGEEYEVDKDNISYDTISDVTKESVWYVCVTPVKWEEPVFLAISDSKKKIVYIVSNTGRIVDP